MLDVIDGHFSREGKVILEKINFTLNSNEIVALVGPNGAGKSSLFNLICGEYSDQGEVILDGVPRQSWSHLSLAEKMAVLPQSSHLNFPFTAHEVVSIGRMNKCCNQTENEAVVNQVMAMFDIDHKANAIYTCLSGGEKQRVQLARVVVQIWEPPTNGERYLLLDEPTAALDLFHQHQLLQQLQQLRDSRVGCFVILHDLNLAARYVDRILVLDQGRLVAQGAPSEVLTPALLHDVFRLDAQVIAHPQHGHPVIVC
ncbi:heme ABC transporter ATP-binding protein [Motilimonas eburnea]|uniref:heme ABC transporter ATP-binding protein n=1 Tax=Motilimonas eburnea TaxID=1737488 RepID=UPI001E458107|nr:heme ABC transporter ATP-binding protein [Motilimonas eburnea]MCE2571342.1 heme ABC transporter ATP-binding protein [Motilimonas eburnea]